MSFSRRPSRVSTSSAVTASREESTFLIRVRGVMDPQACRELEVRIAQAEASDAQRILLDLDSLEELDARALHVILKASRRSSHNGDRLRVTRGNGYVASIFRLTALDQTIQFDG